MVGQMISLNQLQQLININQTLSAPSSSSSTSSAVQAKTAEASDVAGSLVNGGIASTLSPSAAGAATNQLPFDPNTMMPLTSGNPGSLAASMNSSIHTANMGLSDTNNNTFGGK
jgi:hypothetical protein